MFIYLIVNHITGKYYVGQHKGQNLKKYLTSKLWDAEHQRNGQSYLYASMRKHGRFAWSIHALLSNIQTKVELDKCEKDFIEFLRSRDPEYGYNICKGGEGFTGPHTEQWKRDQSKRLRAMGHKPTPEATAKSITVRKTIKEQSGNWPGVKVRDMAGQIVNGIKILQRVGSSEDGDAIWECVCYCGKSFIADGSDIRNNHKRSCGCMKIEQNKKNLTEKNKTREWSVASRKKMSLSLKAYFAAQKAASKSNSQGA